MRKVKLTDICHPKQWKTIAKEKFIKEGYPIYGANGIIGYSNIYNHEDRTILITCRGATCGRINVSQPFSYINGNAMCLDDLSSDVFLEYLELFLRNYDFNQIISGSAQPQITIGNLSKIVIPIPEYEKQVQIARIIKSVESIIEANEKLKLLLDQLVSSRFIEMFGNLKTNEKDWPIKLIKEISECIAGGTPSTTKPEYWVDGVIPWMSSGEINKFRISSTEKKITQIGFDNCSTKWIPAQTVLIALAGQGKTRGKAAITEIPLCANQSIIAIKANKKIDPEFLLQYLTLEYDNLRKISNGDGGRGGLNKRILENYPLMIPPLKLQREFAEFSRKLDKSKY